MSPRVSQSGNIVAGIVPTLASKTIIFQENFFNIPFNCTGNSITNITNVRWFSWFHSQHMWYETKIITIERSSKVIPAVNFIPSKFWNFPQRVSKIVLHTGLNACRESSGDSRFVTNFLLVFFKWLQTSFISCTNLTCPVTFIKVCAQYLFKITCNDDELRQRKALKTKVVTIGNLTKTVFLI